MSGLSKIKFKLRETACFPSHPSAYVTDRSFNFKKLHIHWTVITTAFLIFMFVSSEGFGSVILPTEMSKYLVIGTGEGSSGNEFSSFQMSNVEIGANQEVVSTSDNGGPSQRTGSLQNGSTPNLFGVFLGTAGANAAIGGNRWNDVDPSHGGTGADTVGIPDTLTGARPLFEGIDYSGNVALTGEFAKFESSDSDVNANIGIQCNRAPADCFPDPSGSNSFFSGAAGDPELDLNTLNGVTEFDPLALITEMEMVRDFIVGLAADTTLFASIPDDQNVKSGTGPFVTDLDAIDLAGNNDGFAVFDIDVGDDAFKLNNTDWILNTIKDTFAIFRMKSGSQYDFSNSSVVMGDGTSNSTNTLLDLGAIFFMDAYQGTNELFNNNNVILGAIGMWDFTDMNPDRSQLLNPATSIFNAPVGDQTVINLQNAQGCAQFISHQVLMSNNRWNRCIRISVSEPPSVLIISIGFLCIGLIRRRCKAMQN